MQILSTSMANALAYFGDSTNFDRFFGCLNVLSMSEYGLKRKENHMLLHNDERLTIGVNLLVVLLFYCALFRNSTLSTRFSPVHILWLENTTFLAYLDEWDSYAKAQTRLNERRKLCVCEETLEGLYITDMLYTQCNINL